MNNKIKEMAYKNATDDMESQLKLWWATTYKRPIFHENVGDYTFEELLQEFYMTRFFTDEEFKKTYEKESGVIPKESEDDEAWFKSIMGEDYVGLDKKVNKEDELEIHEKF